MADPSHQPPPRHDSPPTKNYPLMHFDNVTILLLCGLMITAGLIYKRKIDLTSAMLLAVVAAAGYALRDSMSPKMMGVLFIALGLGVVVFGISRTQGGITWFRFIILLVALLICGMAYYINLLPQVLGGLTV